MGNNIYDVFIRVFRVFTRTSDWNYPILDQEGSAFGKPTNATDSIASGEYFPFYTFHYSDWMIPFTRSVVGTSIGIYAALVPLSIGVAPFIARLVENSLLEVPSGLIETARALGASPLQIIQKVLIPEALPSLINNATITLITLVGYSAMGGAVGAGGLGQIGYQYGYIGYDALIMNIVLILLVVLVFIIQYVGDTLSKKFNRK